jgi:hypothetical protein
MKYSIALLTVFACLPACSSVAWDRTTPRAILTTDHTEVSITRAYRDGDKARIDTIVVRPMGAVIEEMSFAIYPPATETGDRNPSDALYLSTGKSNDGEPIFLKDLSFAWQPRLTAEMTVVTDASEKCFYRWTMTADARSD